jgi:hypothetical protein
VDASDAPNRDSLDRLGRLVKLAERLGLYLNLTGLGCYHKQDVPEWYDRLDERERWEAQARFWEAVAERCAGSPAVFCYDLMNEPVVPGGRGKRDDWLGAGFGGKHFVQFITLETKDRPRHEIARAWIRRLAAAVRRHDQETLITVGLVPWSLDRPGLTSGFVPEKIAYDLDFIAVHIYPESGKVDEIESDQHVAITLQQGKLEQSGPFMAITGWAELERNQAEIERLYSRVDDVWFEGPKDPRIVLIRVRVNSAEYWDQRGLKGVRYAWEAVKAAARGGRPTPGSTATPSALSGPFPPGCTRGQDTENR